MIPKEKTIELRDRFYQASLCTIAGAATIFHGNAKILALIAVDEILRVVPMYTGELNLDWEYWQDVKKEIEKL